MKVYFINFAHILTTVRNVGTFILDSNLLDAHKNPLLDMKHFATRELILLFIRKDLINVTRL